MARDYLMTAAEAKESGLIDEILMRQSAVLGGPDEELVEVGNCKFEV